MTNMLKAQVRRSEEDARLDRAVADAQARQTDKLRDAIALAVRTTRGLPTVRENPAILAGVDTLVCLIGSCCKDTDDTFDYDDYLRSCGVRRSLGERR